MSLLLSFPCLTQGQTSPSGEVWWASPRVIDQQTGKGGFVALGDIDGDGDTDIATAEIDRGNIVWFESSLPTAGWGLSWQKHTIASGAGALGVTLADMDIDGDLDVLSTFADPPGSIFWYEFDGANWEGHVIDDTSNLQGAGDLHTVDMDTDGDLDVVVRSLAGVAWYENQTSQWPRHVIGQKFAEIVDVADIDGDGDPDLAAGLYFANQLTWYENTNGSWTEHVVDGNLEGAAGVSCGDADGDGDIDFVASGLLANKVVLYVNDGLAWVPVMLTDALDGAADLEFADLDDDGDLDVIAAGYDANQIVWFENEGATWTEHPVGDVTRPNWIAIGDIDQADEEMGERDLDIVVTTWDPMRVVWFEQERGTATGVVAETLPTSFSLSPNYPNPFNPTTTISYDLPEAAVVTLTVVDLLGRTVRELASGTKPAGSYEVTFDATGLPSGVYFYRLQAGDYVETKRMVVVK